MPGILPPMTDHEALETAGVVADALHVPMQVRREMREADRGADEELEGLAQIYKVLGDPSRLKIIMALTDSEMCVCDLAAFLGVTESAVSHQLRRLRDLSLVKRRREGQILFYSLGDDHVVGVTDDLSQAIRQGQGAQPEPDPRGDDHGHGGLFEHIDQDVV